MAVEAYFGAETVWVSEIDKPASQLIKARINKPNLGNLKIIDWANVESIDIITAGYPCQPFSHAGNRKGADDERHLWPYIKTAISILRPRFVVLENVRGHFGLGFGDVLSDLTHIGYNARWTLVRASDVGAPHRRERLFIVAYPNSTRFTRAESSDIQSQQSRDSSCNTYEFTDSNGVSHNDARRANTDLHDEASKIIDRANRAKFRSGLALIPNSNNGGRVRDVQGLPKRYDPCRPMHMQTVPAPLEQGRLNVEFVEYMMGLPKGWVTDVGLSRAQQLKILGNGVVPQQAYYALQLLLGT